MTRDEFESLVARMEHFATRNPQAYRRRVLAWAALGYGFLFATLLAIAGLILVSVIALKAFAIKFAIVLGPLLYVILRSLWVTFPPPEGPRVTRESAPELFALLDGLRRNLKTPPIAEVVITPELNAAVTQIPRFGPFGGYRNIVMLGLPLMKGLTVEQFKAVLAHELGHLSRGHGRVGNWIYRMRLIWARLEASFEQKAQTGAATIRRFFAWYVPRFNALSFPLARANEYEADAAAVRLTSPLAAAQALTGIHLLGSYLEEKFWPAIHAGAKEFSQPVAAPYSQFLGTALVSEPPDDVARWQSSALARATTLADTHPSLSDRLRAIGAEAQWAPPAAGEGADRLLGSSRESLEAQFDLQWRRNVAPSWQQFYEDTCKARERLGELRRLKSEGPLESESLLELASAEVRVGEGEAAALALRREAVERFPEDAVAHFVLARQLLEGQVGEGVTLMERAIESDLSLREAGAPLLRDYFWSQGDKVAADRWHEAYRAAAGQRVEALRERDILLTTDPYVPHGLMPEALAALQTQLKAIAGLRRAYLVRKLTVHYTETPMYALGFTCSGPLQRSSDDRNEAALASIRERVTFPGQTLILSVEGKNKEFLTLFKRVEGSRLI